MRILFVAGACCALAISAGSAIANDDFQSVITFISDEFTGEESVDDSANDIANFDPDCAEDPGYAAELSCDSECDPGVGCIRSCLGPGSRNFGLLASDHCFDRFISPLSNPFFFEDPRSLTEVRGISIVNSLPDSIGGGDVDVWAAQCRARFAERWSVIAPRLAYLDVNQSDDGAPAGFLSAPIGVKWNFYRDPRQQTLASAGVTYFIPGSSHAISNFGDGDFHFFLTGGTEISERGHWLSASGFRIPTDSFWGTQLWYWSNQWDYEVHDNWYGVFGINWFHWMRNAGLGITDSVTTIDLIDLPVANAAGTDVASAVAGIKWKPSSHLELGSGFEFPITERTDILRNRLYVDLIVRF